ncbi:MULTISPECIES: hypothetical protein [Metabacillus]|jgi:hypothetical protein|uniref:Uncharacterized protein n=2 Tax=Metabacillus TaxID=2675233 RepID=A0A179SNL8_9BACI|nr:MULTISPECIES: hypothetical protein [Metabacillus]OAS83061.1 hypothetical protein A6K24_10565 [Metabacillus litoralis]QNF27615.1 hypothetical protein HUW50_08800 [Metabacillus sp. KUDC1714]
MNKKGSASIQRGQAITFRLPSDTPDHILKQLQKLKETERRNFSSKMAEFILEGVNSSLSKERETVTLPLPKQLNKDQRNWLKHSHSEAMLGSIVYQLLADPIRATSILASLNSNALDINEALYLQEEKQEEIEDNFIIPAESSIDVEQEEPDEVPLAIDDELDNDLMNFDWEKARQEHAATEEDQEEPESVEDLLGGFLANMNK